jgi:opacity protein-like surface antigen
MKKKYILSLLLLLSFASFAQRQVELIGFGGYMLNGKIKTYTGDFPVDDNANYGGIVSIQGYSNTFFELMYNRTDTKFSYIRNGGFGFLGDEKLDISVEYYQAGILHQLDIHDIIKPFGIATIGAVRFHPKDDVDFDGDGLYVSASDEWRMAATVGAGLKFLLSGRVGIRLQARILLPMDFDGLFVGIGTGGVSSGAGFRIPMLSGDFTGGLIIRIGN